MHFKNVCVQVRGARQVRHGGERVPAANCAIAQRKAPNLVSRCSGAPACGSGRRVRVDVSTHFGRNFGQR